MPPNENRSDRDLLIRLETQFASMNDNVNKLDRKFDDHQTRLETAIKSLTENIRNEYVSKEEFKRITDELASFKAKVSNDFVETSRFEPVEDAYNDTAKRIRNTLISAGICLIIAAASVPTWLYVYKNGPTLTASSAQGAK